MRIALAHHEGRISPVFDVASKVLVLEVQGGKEVGREERSLSAASPFRLAAQFLKLEADVLICGAISAPLEALLTASGVQVFGFMCGRADEVLEKFLADGRPGARFRMPGCGPWWAQQTGRRTAMGGGFGLGFGRGRGGKGGRGGGGQGCGCGRAREPGAGGPGGFCVCPSCGEKTPHTPGQPCRSLKCPKCGTAMTRG